MEFPSRLLIFCLLSGSSCAVFYTKYGDDYPRIGRRSFYTTGNGNHYPRIGRRDAPGSSFLLSGSDLSDFATLDKRGVFTQGQGTYNTYPRVGRGGKKLGAGEDFGNEQTSKVLAKMAAMKEEAADQGARDDHLAGQEDDRGQIGYPLEILFIAFDTDSDGKLTKEEFASGMAKYRWEKPLC